MPDDLHNVLYPHAGSGVEVGDVEGLADAVAQEVEETVVHERRVVELVGVSGKDDLPFSVPVGGFHSQSWLRTVMTRSRCCRRIS